MKFQELKYSKCDDIILITSYFNPVGYKTKLQNYKLFENRILESNLKLFTIECALENAPFQLKSSRHIIQLRSNSIIWQKEILLNYLLEHIPFSFSKVIWLDCDVLFTNPDWIVETSQKLNTYKIVQPFKTLIRLPQKHSYYQAVGESWDSFGYVINEQPGLKDEGNFNLHGHTGIAWAARADIILKHGLYDACISGSADHAMAHAMCGNFNDSCVSAIFGPAKIKNKMFRHFLNWAYPFYLDVKSNIGYASGEALHLWHGDRVNRRYYERHQELILLGFDPYKDIVRNRGVWEWSQYSKGLQDWTETYFRQRLEDG